MCISSFLYLNQWFSMGVSVGPWVISGFVCHSDEEGGAWHLWQKGCCISCNTWGQSHIMQTCPINHMTFK